jgi:uncharacterized protein (DUF4415 family)
MILFIEVYDFSRFSESNSCAELNMEDQKTGLSPEFEGSAALPPERVSVTLDLDADILAWLKEQPTDWQREINNTMRFQMETWNAPTPPTHPDSEADYIPDFDP